MALRFRTGFLFAAATLFALPAYANCNGGPFAGPYAGGTVGYGSLKAKQSAPGEPNTDGTDASWIAGALAGYNIQCGTFVGGLEADINRADLDANSSWPDPIFLTSRIDWFGTVRGRIGATVRPNVLIYATGGLAYADVSHRLADPGPPFSQTDSDIQTGWTVGGGIELLHTERWLLRAEVLYVDLGEEHRSYTLTTGCGGVCTGTANWDDTFWTARIGASVKLGRPEERVPLK